MTLDELNTWARENNIPTDMQLAIRAKDDYLVTTENLYTDQPYFGNCRNGSAWQDKNFPYDDDTGEMPAHEVIILDTLRD